MWLSELWFLSLFCFELISTLHSLHSSTFNYLSLNSSTFNFLSLNSSTFRFLSLRSCNLIFSPLFSLQFPFGHFIFHSFDSLLDCYLCVLLCSCLFALSNMFIGVLGVLTLIVLTLLLILKV